MSQFLFEPNNPLYGDYTVTIATTDWTLNNGTYTYSWSNARIAPLNEVEIEFITDPETVLTSDLLYDKLNGSLQFSSVNLPSGSLTLQIKIIKHHQDSIFDLVYPVGSIYMSVNNINPGTLFGGTWVQIEDKFLLSAGNTYTAGDIGGSASHTLDTSELPIHDHDYVKATSINGNTATTDSAYVDFSGGAALITFSADAAAMYYVSTGSWTHNSARSAPRGGTPNAGSRTDGAKLVGGHTHSHNVNSHSHTLNTSTEKTETTGSGTAFSTMPPYLTVYMWKRTA